MTSHTASRLVALVQLVVGIFLVGVGLLMFVQVAVNLPDSWIGAVLAIFLLGAGGSVVWAAARNFRVLEPRDNDAF